GCGGAGGSATSTSNSNQNQNQFAGPASQSGPPPAQQMEPTRALGLWRSTFGAVKIEPDSSRGGLESGNVQGIWVYQRQGQEVVGYFAGSLRGNVLQFRWQEPNDPPLTGEGFLVFDVQGRQYSGGWWSDKRDGVGDWSGWRQAPGRRQQLDSSSPYGGQAYGEDDRQDPQQPQQPSPQQRGRMYRPQQRQPYPQPQ